MKLDENGWEAARAAAKAEADRTAADGFVLSDNIAEAAIRAYLKAVEPEGWKLAPRMPTQEIIEAVIASFGADDDRSAPEKALDAWLAMIAASPAPESGT